MESRLKGLARENRQLCSGTYATKVRMCKKKMNGRIRRISKPTVIIINCSEGDLKSHDIKNTIKLFKVTIVMLWVLQ